VATRVSDPVKMYLKEMGCISLLTREGEVEIAKRIEAGEKEALDALLKCRVGIEYIIELGDLLKNGEIKLKDIINDLDDEDSHTQIGERKESIIRLIDEIQFLHRDSITLKTQALKKGIPAAKKKRIQTKMENDRRRIVQLIGSFKLEKTQIDNMVERLRETVWRVERAEKDLKEVVSASGGKPLAFVKKCFTQIPKTAKEAQLVTPLKLRKSDLLALKSKWTQRRKRSRKSRTAPIWTKRISRIRLIWLRNRLTGPSWPRASLLKPTSDWW